MGEEKKDCLKFELIKIAMFEQCLKYAFDVDTILYFFFFLGAFNKMFANKYKLAFTLN